MDLIKRAMLGDREAQWKVTIKGILLSCYCCGSIGIDLKMEINRRRYYYECRTCGARSKSYIDRNDISIAFSWNSRVPILTDEELKMIGG